MRIMITARHTEVSDALRLRAEELLEKIVKHAPHAQRAEVVFDDDHHRHVAELQVYLPQGRMAVATAEADDFVAALDLAADKLRHQLEGKVTKPGARRRASRKRGAT